MSLGAHRHLPGAAQRGAHGAWHHVGPKHRVQTTGRPAARQPRPVPTDRPSARRCSSPRAGSVSGASPLWGGGHQTLQVWSRTPRALGRVQAPLAHPVHAALLDGLRPLQMPRTYWSWLGHDRDWLGHWNGTGPGDGQVELLGLCDLGLRLRGKGLTGQHLLQLVDQLLDFRLPPGRGRWEKLQRLLLEQAEKGLALGA